MNADPSLYCPTLIRKWTNFTAFFAAFLKTMNRFETISKCIKMLLFLLETFQISSILGKNGALKMIDFRGFISQHCSILAQVYSLLSFNTFRYINYCVKLRNMRCMCACVCVWKFPVSRCMVNMPCLRSQKHTEC